MLPLDSFISLEKSEIIHKERERERRPSYTFLTIPFYLLRRVRLFK